MDVPSARAGGARASSGWLNVGTLDLMKPALYDLAEGDLRLGGIRR